MEPVPRVFAERYELVARLGEGGMGEVFRARDHTRSEDIALKVLSRLDGAELVRFKHEFRALHDIAHPNLVRLHELHEDRGTWFFTMQLIEGVDLDTWVGGQPHRLRVVLPQVARALHCLHAAGLVHRDVKPSNILVTASGHAVLLDFGLVAPTWSLGDGIGTPAFMAPEQIEGHIGPAADWYALGVVIFRALTGRYPFAGSQQDVISAKCRGSAPRVHDLRPGAPADLAALADALLARDATRRPDASSVLAMLGANHEPMRIAADVLIGRDRERELLDEALARCIRREPSAVCVVGDSGIGKTTLLHAFANDAELSSRVWVLRGRCWERESVPYKGFDAVVDELASRLDGLPALAVDAERAAVLVQAFPALLQVPAFAEAGTVVAHDSAHRVPTAVRWLLAEVARHQPLVVVIDDLQWADRDTIAVLRALVEPPLRDVLLAFGARQPVDLGPRANVRQIMLEPLTDVECERLVGIVARDLGGHIDLATIAREASGHPLLAAELARHAVATGEHDVTSLDEIVRATARRLGERVRAIAHVISVAHAPLPIGAVARAIDESGPPLFDAIAALRGAQLIATSGVGGALLLEPYHDRIRRALRGELDAKQLVHLHERVAIALDETPGADAATLALHWADAGKPGVAARHARRAAEQAERALAFHRASELYRWLAELAPDDRDAPIKRAECLGHAGRGVDAAEAYLACAAAAAAGERADLRRRAMQQLLLMGHVERAVELLDQLMAELALPNPTHPRKLLLALLRKRVALRLLPLALRPRATDAVPAVDAARIDLLWDASAGLILVDPLRASYLGAMNFDLAFRVGDDHRQARALLAETPFLAAGGRPTRRLDRVLALTARAAEQTGVAAIVHVARGLTAFFFGRWRQCVTELREADRELMTERQPFVREAFGPGQLLGMTRRFPVAALFYLGELAEVQRLVPDLLADAIERNDLAAATYFRSGLLCVSHLVGDDVVRARENVECAAEAWDSSRGRVPHYLILTARAAIDLYTDNPSAAYARVREMWPHFERTGVFRGQYICISLLDLRARAAIAAARDARGAERGALLADADRCSAKLRRTPSPWARACAEATRGALAAVRGDLRLAATALDAADRCFASADMPVYAANARRVRARVVGDRAAEVAAVNRIAEAGVHDVARFGAMLLPGPHADS